MTKAPSISTPSYVCQRVRTLLKRADYPLSKTTGVKLVEEIGR